MQSRSWSTSFVVALLLCCKAYPQMGPPGWTAPNVNFISQNSFQKIDIWVALHFVADWGEAGGWHVSVRTDVQTKSVQDFVGKIYISLHRRKAAIR